MASLQTLSLSAAIVGETAGPTAQAVDARWLMAYAAAVGVDDAIHVHTIGDAAPLGICGSGLIDLVAGLLDAGLIDPTGLIQVERRDTFPPRLRERVTQQGEERQIVVVRSGELEAPRDIVLTQDDVRQVQLAKGAIASGVAMLLHVAAVRLDDLDDRGAHEGYAERCFSRNAKTFFHPSSACSIR